MANGSNLGEPRQSCTTHPSSNTADVMISEKNIPSAVATRLTGTKLLPKKMTATKHAMYPTASSWSVIPTFRRARACRTPREVMCRTGCCRGVFCACVFREWATAG